MPTQAMLKKRDKKENELDTLKEQVAINKKQILRVEKGFDKSLEQYKEWCVQNNVPGEKY